jgi:GNAT superfamily N-acetyltransferase
VSESRTATAALDLSVQNGRAVRSLLRAVWGAERDLAGEYPLLFDDTATFAKAPGTFVTLRVGNLPVATCAYLERVLATPFGDVSVALLGSVSTHPEHRGRGYAGHVLAGAQTLAQSAGCVATLLWPMDTEVYRKSGFQPVACEWNVVLPTDLALGAPISQRRAHVGDVGELLALHDRHAVRVRRSRSEFARQLACPAMDVRVALEHGRPIAYACRGRGGDLVNCVHEWAGEPNAVLALVSSFAREDAASPRYLLAPDWASPVTEALLDAGCAAVMRPLGMGKLASRAAACRWLSERTGHTFVARANDSAVVVGAREEVFTDAELLTAILPPAGECEPLRSVAARLERAPESVPAYAFCWGLDSI